MCGFGNVVDVFVDVFVDIVVDIDAVFVVVVLSFGVSKWVREDGFLRGSFGWVNCTNCTRISKSNC